MMSVPQGRFGQYGQICRFFGNVRNSKSNTLGAGLAYVLLLLKAQENAKGGAAVCCSKAMDDFPDAAQASPAL